MARRVQVTDLRGDAAWVAATAVLAAVLAGAVTLAGNHLEATLLLAVAGLAVAYMLMARFVVQATVVLVVAAAVVPIYWAIPPSSYIPTALTPAVALGCLLAPIAVSKWGPVQMNALDWLVLLLVIAGVATNYLDYQKPTQVSVGLVMHVGLLYLGVRLFAVDRERLVALSVAVAATGGVLGFLGLVERLNGYNVFLEVRKPGYLAVIWGQYYVRFGAIRAATSFGQPLPYGLFLAVCVVLLAALLTVSARRGLRLLAVVGLAGCLGGLWASQTRGPLAVAVIGYLLFVVSARKIRWASQVVVPAVVLGTVAALSPLGAQIVLFWNATFSGNSSDASFNNSTAYRGSLTDALSQGRNYSFLGIARGNPFDQSAAQGVAGSVDNEFLLRLLQYGAVGLVLFVAIGVVLLWLCFRAPDPLMRAWVAATAATYLGLFTVALLLQQADFFWMGVAVGGAGLAAAQGGKRVVEAGV